MEHVVMARPPALDIHALGYDLAALLGTHEHDIALEGASVDDDALYVRTRLHSTARTSNAGGTIFGGNLFTLAELTSALAFHLAVLDVVRQDDLLVFVSTRGGTIAYLQAATSDVRCSLLLFCEQVRSIQEELRARPKVTRILTLEMHDLEGGLVARTSLTVEARRVSPRAARRLPTVGRRAVRLREIASERLFYAIGR
jgi:acyl-coenzyme A thioesterase PaaI-like protein